MKKLFSFVLIISILLIVSPIVLGHETGDPHEESNLTFPANIQKIENYNNSQAEFYMKNLSFLIAFLAGILGILTPCSLSIFPAFFAYSFREKKEITKMTFGFFLGFLPVFVLFGFLAAFLGKSIAMLQQSGALFVKIAGFLIIFFGILSLFGKGFSGIKIDKKPKKNFGGVFLFGVLFALGFTICMGPILVGTLLIASVFQSYLHAAILMLFYSLGLFVPLFLISISFDKNNFAEQINKINKKLGFSITNLIAGILFIVLGLVFIIFGGTFITNGLGLGGLTVFIYSLQNKLVLLKFVNILGLIILAGFIYLLWTNLSKRGTKNETKEK